MVERFLITSKFLDGVVSASDEKNAPPHGTTSKEALQPSPLPSLFFDGINKSKIWGFGPNFYESESEDDDVANI